MGVNENLKRKRWMSYKAASITARDCGVTSRDRYWRWWDKERPLAMPKFPHRVYIKEWKGWNDFLGTENMFIPKTSKKKIWWPYPQAMKWAHTQGWKTQEDFNRARAEGKLPIEMPRWPSIQYKGQGWIGWPVFLGKKAQAIVEAARLNLSILALCIPPDMPGGYMSIVIEDSPIALKEHLHQQNLQAVKLYRWEPEKKAELNQVLSRAGSLKNAKDNLWLIRNASEVISDLDQLLLWYRP